MKYYIFKDNWSLNFLENEEPFINYISEGINIGKKLNSQPKITLKFKSKQIPDHIPNSNGLIIFNQAIISILKGIGIDYIQYFDIDVLNIEGEVITGDYKCLNILKVIEGIDFEKSKLKWSELDEGESEDDKFILGVLDLRLNYSNIDNEAIFRLKGLEDLLLFREDLAQAIVDKGCTGLEFYPAEGYSF